MSPDSRRLYRKSIRYRGYDYTSGGAYFVTVCTKNRLPVLKDELVSAIVTDVWHALPTWFPTIALDAFVIMPNHVHFVVWLGVEDDRSHGGRGQAPPLREGLALACGEYELPVCETPRLTPTLGDVVGAWKSLIFITCRRWGKANASAQRAKFWQRTYYDRVIRHERGLQAIRDYIDANPARWLNDPDNPDNLPGLPLPKSIDDYLDDVRRLHQSTQPGR